MAKKSLLIIVLAILLIGLLLLGILRSGTHTNKTTTEVNLYQKQANKICKMLDDAFTLYKNKQSKKAYTLAESAYWDVYDNVLEIKYRSYATPAYIFGVEGKFHAASTALAAPISAKNTAAITTQIKALCTEVNAEVAYLNKHS